ncbi:GIY-YIG nuclease family protein [Nocardioides sp. zg-579]|uniref:GIY-YIG nuclease family protein n=1 Tax=Nocardioides marmotae TaxID=2663857 RepID=A0A6I3J5D3_9ACTN|nr:GIY-YIG nuclease family protein [Nocardioides marmotae]MCR6030799.1 GIY-YIG nuclease family protein [Gordonia jinghuaiqii]MTB94434.1 GIY-YIG nuclease family protein [Nocardioides marmotae]QKE01544.1 GIY-YIG nuclease family protein [Nocardioides marmotae]
MEAIPLAALLPAGLDATAFKVHFAVWNGIKHPIDVLATNQQEWQGWNSWRSVKDDFNREFIFSVAQDKHDATRWLFGGIWEVLDRKPEQQAHSYTVAVREDLMGPFIRRLYIRHKRTGRNIRRTMESVLPTMFVSSILEEPFAGDPFPGHDRINHSLADLQAVVAQARADWRIALESMKGVYVIHDKETGQRYVGSAYGDTGVWQRWSTYAATLHGGNVGLKEVVDAKGEEYYRTNMRFALLEYWSMRTDDDHVLERESYWKEVLHARSLGHNKN